MQQPLTFEVSGLGAFEAKHRTIGVQLQIERAYQECLGGPEAQSAESLRTVAAVSSQLKTLLTRAPDGWSVETADLNDCYAVFAALRSAEEAFRSAVEQKRQGGSQAL